MRGPILNARRVACLTAPNTGFRARGVFGTLAARQSDIWQSFQAITRVSSVAFTNTYLLAFEFWEMGLWGAVLVLTGWPLQTWGCLTMKFLATTGAALLLSCLSVSSVAADSLKRIPTKPGAVPNAITISCFRGPSSTVIWDRPNAVFIHDLVRIGYTFPEAHAIGERICRDEYGLGQHGYMSSSLQQIIATTPPTN